jgi:energy-coupling factor transporter transmembrane protein EcfT
MLGLIVVALIIWLVLVVLGFVIKGLFWLAIIGIVLFVVTAGAGARRGRARR